MEYCVTICSETHINTDDMDKNAPNKNYLSAFGDIEEDCNEFFYKDVISIYSCRDSKKYNFISSKYINNPFIFAMTFSYNDGKYENYSLSKNNITQINGHLLDLISGIKCKYLLIFEINCDEYDKIIQIDRNLLNSIILNIDKLLLDELKYGFIGIIE